MTDELAAQVLAELRALRVLVLALGAGRAELELLHEAAAYFADADWTADELLAGGELDEGLAAALTRAGIRSDDPRAPVRLGAILRHLRGIPLNGLVLVQTSARNRRGVAEWKLQGVPADSPHAPKEERAA